MRIVAYPQMVREGNAMTPGEIKKLIDSNASWCKPSDANDILTDGYLSTPHLINLLTCPYGNIANTIEAPKIPKPMTLTGIIGLFGSSSLAKLLGLAGLTDIRDKILAQDFAAVGLWASLLLTGGIIESSEYSALTARLSETISDPNWPAVVPGPSLLMSAFGTETIDAQIVDQALGRA